MNHDPQMQAMLENQKLILERLAHIEADLHAVFQIQGDYLKGELDADQARRDDIRSNYSKLPEAMIEYYLSQGLNKHQQGL